MPLASRVVNVTSVGLLLFSIVVLIIDPNQWRFALTEISVGLILLRIVNPEFGKRSSPSLERIFLRNRID